MTEKQKESVPAEMPPEVADLHGIAYALAKELQPGDGEEFAPLNEDQLTPVCEYLLELTQEEDGAEELMHAIRTIGAFSIGNKASSPTLATQVSELLDLPYVVDAVKKWSISADPEEVKRVAERFGNFAGIDTQKKAPKVGEEKPEGSVDLNALKFPKRL